MDYARIGYAMNASLAAMTREDTRRLTHLNLAFGLIKNGVVDLEMVPDIGRVEQFRRWNPALKILLSVGGWGAGGFSAMAMTEAGRRAFAASCLAVVERYGLDGIDIDWEYPCSGAAGIDYDPRDRENFPLLLEALRDALGSGRILSIAVGADKSCVDVQMARVSRIVDYVQLMTYDMMGAFPGRTGHHAGLALSRGVVERYHDAGVPYGKMVLGVAFYGRRFQVESAENNGLGQRAGEALPGPAFGEITEKFRRENGYREFWDEAGEAAYLFNGVTFISYESPEAVRRKCEYVKKRGMKGLMYWEQGNDPGRILLGVIAKCMR